MLELLNSGFKKKKFFCIGLNKTGTTSLAKAFQDAGFLVDSQREAHQLMFNYENREFGKIVEHCKKSEVFQDAPFSMKYTYMFLEQAYPNAKFILSVRDSAEQWYNSFIRFQSQQFGLNGRLPNKEDLMKAKRPHGRTVYMNLKMRFDTPDDNIYEKDSLISYYHSHLSDVIDYFRLLPGKLLVINLAAPDSFSLFCTFLNIKSKMDSFPWLNKS